MASGGKKKTTFAKLAREQKLRERRLEKKARKDARKQTAEPDLASAQRERPPARPAVDPDRDQLRSLEERVEHLEALVQGVQDSMHRESLRQSARLSELEAQIQPAALGKALSDDARARGL